jgi:electron transfer flavoprotein beta subunit
LVPDVSSEIEIDADGRDIDREWLEMKLNEFDEHALEEAVLLKERLGAKVTAVAIEGEGTDRMLQGALARGADEAVKINRAKAEPIASRVAAGLFAEAARRLEAGLFLTGVQTPEDTFGQLGPFVGAILDWPCVSAVSKVVTGEGHFTVTQELSGGATATLKVPTPAVLAIQTASQPVRYVAGSKLREAASRPIRALDVDAEEAAPLETVLAVSLPERARSAELLEGEAGDVAGALYALLAKRGLLKG